MPDPTTIDDVTVRAHMAEYPVDTMRHFIPGALLEPRYLQLVQWVPNGGLVLDVGCNSGAAGMRLKVDRPNQPIREFDAQLVRSHDLESRDPINRMLHASHSTGVARS